MGRSFANLHIKSKSLEKTVEALRELSEGNAEVLGMPSNEDQEKVVMYVSKSNENWISVLHDYFVWGTVKEIGKTLSRLIEEPVMTGGYINEEIFELSFFENGDIQAERIFCEQWTRDEYEELKEERLNDDYLRKALDIRHEDFDDFIRMTSPQQAVDKLSEFVSMSLWSDWEWIPHEETLRTRFGKYEF
ncbi:hypothetical protein [Paenibacillus nasutitermitis]|uniref:Uncharacterized protein n=1 Tax=Paenibacillus nasutitermitis TaxID=1652958 RepID=A0A917DZ59_9BACL|nr:hypothetical protein [Paenibacillus nasutitermitis]GGD80870.1 hypothetical protein GCM10010911_43770 [Paenibacillus nasutitermitis]